MPMVVNHVEMAPAYPFERAPSECDPFSEQTLSHGEKLLRIDVQYLDRRPTDIGKSDKHGTVPLKMQRPIVKTRMIQADQLACNWINARDICALGDIATKASERQVVGNRWATVFSGNDVIHTQRLRVVFLSQVAVLAASGGASPHEVAQGSADHGQSRCRHR
jgi:hypothetical protein